MQNWEGNVHCVRHTPGDDSTARDLDGDRGSFGDQGIEIGVSQVELAMTVDSHGDR
jgi:hypothetical protein